MVSSQHPPPAYLSPVPAPASSATLHHMIISTCRSPDIRLPGLGCSGSVSCSPNGINDTLCPLHSRGKYWILSLDPVLHSTTHNVVCCFVSLLSKTDDTERNWKYCIFCIVCHVGHFRDTETETLIYELFISQLFQVKVCLLRPTFDQHWMQLQCTRSI